MAMMNTMIGENKMNPTTMLTLYHLRLKIQETHVKELKALDFAKIDAFKEIYDVAKDVFVQLVYTSDPNVVLEHIVAEEEEAQDAGHRKRAFYKFYVLLELIPIFYLEVPGDTMIYEENGMHILSLHAKSQKLHEQDPEIVLIMNDREIRDRIQKFTASFGDSVTLKQHVDLDEAITNINILHKEKHDKDALSRAFTALMDKYEEARNGSKGVSPWIELQIHKLFPLLKENGITLPKYNGYFAECLTTDTIYKEIRVAAQDGDSMELAISNAVFAVYNHGRGDDGKLQDAMKRVLLWVYYYGSVTQGKVPEIGTSRRNLIVLAKALIATGSLKKENMALAELKRFTEQLHELQKGLQDQNLYRTHDEEVAENAFNALNLLITEPPIGKEKALKEALNDINRNMERFWDILKLPSGVQCTLDRVINLMRDREIIMDNDYPNIEKWQKVLNLSCESAENILNQRTTERTAWATLYEDPVDQLFKEYDLKAIIYFYHLGAEYHDREKAGISLPLLKKIVTLNEIFNFDIKSGEKDNLSRTAAIEFSADAKTETNLPESLESVDSWNTLMIEQDQLQQISSATTNAKERKAYLKQVCYSWGMSIQEIRFWQENARMKSPFTFKAFYAHFLEEGHDYAHLFFQNDAIMYKYLYECEQYLGHMFSFEKRTMIGFSYEIPNLNRFEPIVKTEVEAMHDRVKGALAEYEKENDDISYSKLAEVVSHTVPYMKFKEPLTGQVIDALFKNSKEHRRVVPLVEMLQKYEKYNN